MHDDGYGGGDDDDDDDDDIVDVNYDVDYYDVVVDDMLLMMIL